MNDLLSILDPIPEDIIAITVYLGGSFIILWCWYLIAQRLPKLLGGISWVIVFAILLTPTVSEGPNSELAPATFGLVFGILTKNQSLIWLNASLITFVIGIGLIIGYFWSKYLTLKNNTSASPKLPPL